MSDWVDWEYSEDKPYPETLDTLVNVKTREGDDSCLPPLRVGDWYCEDYVYSNWYNHGSNIADIVAYRICE